MKMDVFCADIAVSLDTDARIQNTRTFHIWNEDWQQLLKDVGPRGDLIMVLIPSSRSTPSCTIIVFTLGSLRLVNALWLEN
jgi:hypothetical protein